MPHYVILRKTVEDDTAFVLHGHTIPSFIPLQELCEEHLEKGVSGLEVFATTLHRYLILLSNRAAVVSRIRMLKGVEEVRADEAVRLVEVLRHVWTAKIVLMDDGERCVVINHDGKRMKEVEQVILNKEAGKDIVERIAKTL